MKNKLCIFTYINYPLAGVVLGNLRSRAQLLRVMNCTELKKKINLKYSKKNSLKYSNMLSRIQRLSTYNTLTTLYNTLRDVLEFDFSNSPYQMFMRPEACWYHCAKLVLVLSLIWHCPSPGFLSCAYFRPEHYRCLEDVLPHGLFEFEPHQWALFSS